MPHSTIIRRRRISKLENPPPFDEFRASKESEFKNDYEQFHITDKNKYLVEFKDISRKGYHYFLREAWDIFEQSNMRGKKAFVVERFRRIRTTGDLTYPVAIGQVEIRISYYIVNPLNRWWFGESCAIVPVEDTPKLVTALRRVMRFTSSS